MINDADIAPLVRRFEKAERKLEDDLALLAVASGLLAIKARRRVLAEMEKLRTDAFRWSSVFLPIFLTRAIKRVGQLPIAEGSISQAQIQTIVGSLFPKVQRDFMGFVSKALGSILSTTNIAGRSDGPSQLLNRRVAELQTQMSANQVLDLQSKVKDKLSGKLVSIVGSDALTKRYSLGYYIALVAVSMKVMTDRLAVTETAGQIDTDLVKVSDNYSTIGDFCDAFRSKIFSISGEHPIFPPLSSAPNGGPPFHPWCYHTISPIDFDDGSGDDPTSPFVPNPSLLDSTGTIGVAEIQRLYRGMQ